MPHRITYYRVVGCYPPILDEFGAVSGLGYDGSFAAIPTEGSAALVPVSTLHTTPDAAIEAWRLNLRTRADEHEYEAKRLRAIAEREPERHEVEDAGGGR